MAAGRWDSRLELVEEAVRELQAAARRPAEQWAHTQDLNDLRVALERRSAGAKRAAEAATAAIRQADADWRLAAKRLEVSVKGELLELTRDVDDKCGRLADLNPRAAMEAVRADVERAREEARAAADRGAADARRLDATVRRLDREVAALGAALRGNVDKLVASAGPVPALEQRCAELEERARRSEQSAAALADVLRDAFSLPDEWSPWGASAAAELRAACAAAVEGASARRAAAEAEAARRSAALRRNVHNNAAARLPAVRDADGAWSSALRGSAAVFRGPLGAFFLRRAAELGGAASVDGESLGDVVAGVRRAAAGLAGSLGPGDVLALVPGIGSQARDVLVLLHAALARGAAVAVLCPRLAPAELARQVEAAGARLVWRAGDPLPDASPREDSLATVSCDDDALLLFTAGTGRPPELVRLSHARVVGALEQLAAVDVPGAMPGDAVLNWLPLWRAEGLLLGLHAPLMGGASVVSSSPSAGGGVDVALVPPGRLREVAALEGVMDVVVAGAPLPFFRLARLREARPELAVSEVFAAADLGGVALVGPARSAATAAWAALLPGARCRVVGVTSGAALGVGQAGVLWISPAPGLDFVCTGDVGFVDAAGRVALLGRADRLILTPGGQVAPSEIEAIVGRHALVEDVAVGPGGVARVVLSSSGACGVAEEIVALVAAAVGAKEHKRVQRVEFVEEIERTHSGQVVVAPSGDPDPAPGPGLGPGPGPGPGPAAAPPASPSPLRAPRRMADVDLQVTRVPESAASAATSLLRERQRARPRGRRS